MKINLIAFAVLSLMLLACKKETIVEEDDYLFSLTIDENYSIEQIEERLEGIKRIGELILTKEVENLNFLNGVSNIGELRISSETKLTSLDPIYDITINKTLSIYCENLKTLKQFNQISELSSLGLKFGEEIKVIRLENLTKIRTGMIIRGSHLEEIHLPDLEEVEGVIRIIEAPMLTTINFPKLKEAPRLEVKDNPVLVSMGNWPQLERIDNIFIRDNEMLLDISFLEAVDIDNSIHIYDCDIEDFCILEEKILDNPELSFFLRSSDNQSWELSDFEQCP